MAADGAPPDGKGRGATSRDLTRLASSCRCRTCSDTIGGAVGRCRANSPIRVAEAGTKPGPSAFRKVTLTGKPGRICLILRNRQVCSRSHHDQNERHYGDPRPHSGGNAG